MKRSDLIEGLKDGIADHKLDPREDLHLYITEAIKELEGTRSIEEVRERIEYHDTGDTLYSGRATRMDEDRWFLKGED